jgi:hypothetical protein
MTEKKKVSTVQATLLPGYDIIHHYYDERNGHTGYIVKKGERGLEFKDKYEEPGFIYVPNPKSSLPYAIPTRGELKALLSNPDGSTIDADEKLSPAFEKKLFADVEEYIRKTVELPNEDDYLLLTAYVIHTYLIEHANASAFMYFYGTHGSGKSRAGGVLGRLVFRGFHSSSLTEAVLFRFSETYHLAFIIDETDLRTNSKLRDMLKVRYKDGISIARINDHKLGEAGIGIYDAYGPTAICTTEI